MSVNNVVSHINGEFCPHCMIPVKRDPRAYVPADVTNIRNTWKRSLESDYETVNRQDWLEIGNFK